MFFSRKNTVKDKISGIIENDDIHARKYGNSSDRKIKDDKKVPMILRTFMETFISVFIYSFAMKKQQETNIVEEILQ